MVFGLQLLVEGSDIDLTGGRKGRAGLTALPVLLLALVSETCLPKAFVWPCCAFFFLMRIGLFFFFF